MLAGDKFHRRITTAGRTACPPVWAYNLVTILVAGILSIHVPHTGEAKHARYALFRKLKKGAEKLKNAGAEVRIGFPQRTILPPAIHERQRADVSVRPCRVYFIYWSLLLQTVNFKLPTAYCFTTLSTCSSLPSAS
jgi:hypothetical protein